MVSISVYLHKPTALDSEVYASVRRAKVASTSTPRRFGLEGNCVIRHVAARAC